MKSGPLVFLAAFLALSASWGGFVLAPQIQLGRSAQTVAIGSGNLYPQARSGLAQQGAEVYRANGCVSCHSQQVGQEATRCEVVLTDVGTNLVAVQEIVSKLTSTLAKGQMPERITGVPTTIMRVADVNAAEPVLKMFETVGAQARAWVTPLGSDIARGWGKRRTVAQDYLYDLPVQLGSRRIGPDLANTGARLPDANWHLLHLYAPQSLIPGSTMPPYRFLFATRKTGRAPSPDALQLPDGLAPKPGFEIVPTPEAHALVAYLLSLRADAPLFEAPVTPPFVPKAAATNAPASTPTAK